MSLVIQGLKKRSLDEVIFSYWLFNLKKEEIFENGVIFLRGILEGLRYFRAKVVAVLFLLFFVEIAADFQQSTKC